jgi:hypothetical protein
MMDVLDDTKGTSSTVTSYKLELGAVLGAYQYKLLFFSEYGVRYGVASYSSYYVKVGTHK